MQHYGDIVLRGVRVEAGTEIKRLRDFIGGLRERELGSALVQEDLGAAETRKLLEQIKKSPGFTVTPVYSPQTVYWIKFDHDDPRMVVEDAELKTLRVVRPQAGDRLSFQGFWIAKPDKGGQSATTAE